MRKTAARPSPQPSPRKRGEGKIGAVLRSPLLHFLLLGALLFVTEQLVPQAWRAGPREPLHVGRQELQDLGEKWAREIGRPLSPAELHANLREHLDEEMLVREALRTDLDRRDPAVRQRLLQNMRFAFPAAAGDDARLLREARALGMLSRDLVVRRRLAQAMKRRLAEKVAVSDAELQAVLTQRAQAAAAERIAFSQVYFSSDVAGRDAGREARALLPRLQGDGAIAVETLGDPFLLGRQFPLSQPAEIARAFGESFARQLAASPQGVWAGPIASAYGWHLVRVEAIERATRAAESAARRKQAYYLLVEAREKQAVRDGLQALRQKYPVTVEWPELAMRDPP